MISREHAIFFTMCGVPRMQRHLFYLNYIIFWTLHFLHKFNFLKKFQRHKRRKESPDRPKAERSSGQAKPVIGHYRQRTNHVAWSQDERKEVRSLWFLMLKVLGPFTFKVIIYYRLRNLTCQEKSEAQRKRNSRNRLSHRRSTGPVAPEDVEAAATLGYTLHE